MKALFLEQNEKLVLEERPRPTPGSKQVLVKMKAITLNHLDLFSYRGMAFATRKLPIIVGAEGAGQVVAIGKDAENSWLDKNVAIFPGILCGTCHACHTGQENLCADDKAILGFKVDGLAAEYVTVNQDQLVEIPDGISWKHAACAPITFGTVVHMLFDNAKLQPGESILIHAGGSGIGSSAIRLAKNMDVTVYTTVGSEAKAAKARELGADVVINYNEKNFSREIRKATNKKGVDVVFEHVGVDTWQGSMNSLKLGGRLVTCGSTTGVETQFNLFQLFNRQIKIFGSFGGNKRNIAESLAFMKTGVLPEIDSTYSLGDFEKGLDKLRRRDVFGKIILEVSE